jgi:PleD family two-component response regulator
MWRAQGVKGSRQFYSDVNNGTSLILSVDDDSVNHMVLEGFLKPKGYIMHVCMSGQEAIDFLTECPSLPDLILLDVMMPMMSGYQVRSRSLISHHPLLHPRGRSISSRSNLYQLEGPLCHVTNLRGRF